MLYDLREQFICQFLSAVVKLCLGPFFVSSFSGIYTSWHKTRGHSCGKNETTYACCVLLSSCKAKTARAIRAKDKAEFNPPGWKFHSYSYYSTSSRVHAKIRRIVGEIEWLRHTTLATLIAAYATAADHQFVHHILYLPRLLDEYSDSICAKPLFSSNAKHAKQRPQHRPTLCTCTKRINIVFILALWPLRRLRRLCPLRLLRAYFASPACVRCVLWKLRFTRFWKWTWVVFRLHYLHIIFSWRIVTYVLYSVGDLQQFYLLSHLLNE